MKVGLTGKSCAGKDEVAKILESFGCLIIDVDHLGHIALNANKGKLIEAFGEEILTDNEIDRKKLGPIVFSDKNNLKKLEAISHPWMIEEAKRIAKEGEEDGKIAIINAAILSRLGLDKISDAIIFVDAPFEIRAKRAELRNGTKPEEFRKRDESGKDISSSFNNYSGSVITILNDSDKETLYRQVKDIYDRILKRG